MIEVEEVNNKLGKSDDGYRRFKLVFHSIILIFGLCLMAASITGFNEMERSPLYLILGILFIIESIFGLYKNRKQKLQH